MPLNPWIDADRRELENEATAEAWLERIRREEEMAGLRADEEGLGFAHGLLNAGKIMAIGLAALALGMHFIGY